VKTPTAQLFAYLLAGAVLTLSTNASAQSRGSYGARARSRPQPSAGAATLETGEARETAGAMGEPMRALSTLSGVSRAGYDGGALIVWGADPNATQAYIDGVPLPVLFHPGGLRSAVLPSLTENMTLTKGAPDAQFGRSTGGVLEVRTRELPDSAHVNAEVSNFDAGAALQAGTGPVRAAWGGRWGYMDRLVRELSSRAGEVVPVPEYADGYAKLQVRLDQHATLSAVWLGTHDAWQRGTLGVDPASSRVEDESRVLQLGYIQFQREYADRARAQITPFISWTRHDLAAQNGPTPWTLQNTQLSYGLRSSYSLPGPMFDFALGLDALATQSDVKREGSLTLPPREGDITVFAQPPPDATSRDAYTTHDFDVAVHATVTARLGRLTLTPGLRLDAYVLSASRSLPKLPETPAIGSSELLLRPEPRILARFFFNEAWSMSARAALSNQPVAPEDRSAVFGNPALTLSRALTVAGGPNVRLGRTLDVELTGYYKEFYDLPTRNPARPLPLTAALLPEGKGKAFGAELSLRLRPTPALTAQLSYTLSRALRTDLEQPERLFDYDQTHVCSFLWSARLGAFMLSGRARVATGSPRTPVVNSYKNLKNDRYEPVFGEHNSIRLPMFFALDMRIEHDFALGALTGSFWLDVSNVTNYRNVEDIAYRYDYQARRDVKGLPTLAVLGVTTQL